MLRHDKFERLRARRTPIEKIAFAVNESIAQGSGNKEYQYLVDSMQPISEEYTEKTFEEAKRVESQLKAGLPVSCAAEFDYQGSVTSDTHIRIHSDIDLLVMDGRFISLDPGAPNNSPYLKNSLQELLDLRRDSAAVLKNKFPAAVIDDKPGKAISVSGGSLSRKIDVIVGNWWDTETYRTHKVKVVRGIDILDSKIPRQIKNKPFFHNYKIDEKDKSTLGLRKVIRLLKTLKYDAEPQLKISSYDITSLAWNMRDEMLKVQPGSYLSLAQNANAELERFVNNPMLRDSLFVPNGTRKIFSSDGATVDGLMALQKELAGLLASIGKSQLTVLLYESLSSAGQQGWQEKRAASVRAHSF